jgi:predicted flap endonuclease-1-like 5' DNA nuclease
MWPLCTFSLGSALWLLLPLLLGLITGWAIWAGRRSDADLAYAAPEPVRAPDPVRVTEPVAAPVAAPVAPKVEPVAAAAVPKAAPVAAAPKVAPVAAAAAVAMTAIGIPAAVGAADDLLQIKGVGPKLNELLISLGVRRFDQIAAWGRGEVEKVDSHLGSFKGRIDRDSWIDQAGLLAKGMIKEFEAKYGKLDSENQ